MAAEPRRVQFVISGWFLAFSIIGAGCLGGGYWLYTHQPPPVQPPLPPYYVNRIVTAIRSCFQCIGADGKLKPQESWKLGKSVEIPEDATWWFSPVDDHGTATKVDGVPMLAVHPAVNNEKPWEGFDQRRVLLVVLQDLEAKFSIEHPAPPPPPVVVPTLEPTRTPEGSQFTETHAQQP